MGYQLFPCCPQCRGKYTITARITARLTAVNTCPGFRVSTLKTRIRLISQGTVDNNLGPDHLAGPKALDPNYCRQSSH